MTTKNCLPGESRFFVTRIENFLFAFSFFFFFFNISFSDEMRFYSVYTVLEYIAIG